MTKFLDVSELFQLACKATGKHGLLLSCSLDEDVDPRPVLARDVPWLSEEDRLRLIFEYGFVLFDTEEEREKAYHATRGDDDQGTVYALTCGPDGQLRNENT